MRYKQGHRNCSYEEGAGTEECTVITGILFIGSFLIFEISPPTLGPSTSSFSSDQLIQICVI